jgi:threonine dehydrogenase-like Zn-dependent dehydrogenase
VGDRVAVPFTFPAANAFCQRGYYLVAHDRILIGAIRPPVFGYSHLLGGYSGGQAEFLRVPWHFIGPIKVTDPLTDDQVPFPVRYLSNRIWARPPSFATFSGATLIAIWGCGPVGQMPSPRVTSTMVPILQDVSGQEDGASKFP